MFGLNTLLPERIRQEEDLMFVGCAGPVFISLVIAGLITVQASSWVSPSYTRGKRYYRFNRSLILMVHVILNELMPT